jgi:acetyltransferase
MADINFSELITNLNNDPETKVIALYIESVVNGLEFMEAISKSKKPVLVLKAGTTSEGSGAISSHTGSLAVTAGF